MLGLPKLVPSTLAVCLRHADTHGHAASLGSRRGQFLSLHQKDASGARTPAEATAFTTALGSMALWYAHAHTAVFIIRNLPSYNPRWRGMVAHSGRGWTTCEALWASLGKLTSSYLRHDRGLVFEVSVAAPQGQQGRQPALTSSLSSGITALGTAPLGPIEAAALLARKRFTSKKADLPTVISLHVRTTLTFFRNVKALTYESHNWGDMEACQLATVLSYCEKLQSLNLQKNNIEDQGVIAIGKWLQTTSAPVEVLGLSANNFSLRGAAMIASALKHNQSLNGITVYVAWSKNRWGGLGKECIQVLEEAVASRGDGVVKVVFH